MNRDNRFDFYKGLLIIGVIWGHVITALKCGDSAYPWIHLFVRTYDMSMFAFISGFFLKKSTENITVIENIFNKITGILFPVVLWTLVYNFIVNAKIFQFRSYWFLWSIFWCSCIVILVDGLFKDKDNWKNICFALIIILCHMGLGESRKVGFLLLPCVVGYYFAQREQVPQSFRVNAFLICLFVILQCFWSLKYNVWNAGVNIFAHGTPVITAGKAVFRSVIGIVGCFVMKICFDAIYDLLTISRYLQMHMIQNWIVSIGQNTLALYILQTFLVESWGATLVRKIVGVMGENPFVFNVRFMGYCLAPIITIFSLVVLMWCKKMICLIPHIGTHLFGTKIKPDKILMRKR